MEWFLITADEHLGPFSSEVVHQLFSSGEITDESLLWREGWGKPKSYREILLTDELEDDAANEYVEIDLGDENDDDALPPDLPVEKTSQPLKKSEEYDFDFNDDTGSYLDKMKYLSAALIILALVVSIILYRQSLDNLFERPQSMNMTDFRRLQKTSRSLLKKLQFDFALAMDKRTLWVSTNLPLEGEVFLKLRSKTGQTLGEEVELKAKGNLEKRLIVLSDFQFIKGTKFVDGVYDVEIFTVERLEAGFYQQFFDTWDREFRYLDKVTITSLSKREFQRQMKKISQRKIDNKNEFWSELVEKYRTIMNMSSQIRDAVNIVFSAPRNQWNSEVSLFENKYKTQYGIFFTSFVTNNEGSYKYLMNKKFPDKFEIISSYTRLSKLAKMIGTESMTILQNLESFDPESRTQSEILSFQEKNLLNLERIIKECERKLTEFSARE